MPNSIDSSEQKSAIGTIPPKMNERTASQIFDGEYFEILVKEADTLVVRCNMCGPDGPQLRASTKSNGNILKHINRRHAAMLHKIKVEKNIKSRTSKFENSMERKPRNSAQIKTQPIKSEFHFLENTPNNDETEMITSDNDILIQVNSASIDSNDENHSQVQEKDTEEGRIHYEVYENERYNDREIEIIEENQSCDNPSEILSNTHTLLNGGLTASLTKDSMNSIRFSKELLEFQKELMQHEYDDMQALRAEKHQLEMAILKADLAHKTMEHQKRMEILNKKLKEK